MKEVSLTLRAGTKLELQPNQIVIYGNINVRILIKSLMTLRPRTVNNCSIIHIILKEIRVSGNFN